MISGALIKRAAVWLAALQFFFAPFVAAQESDFYRGKTIRIVVGFSPGGGYDANARLLSRYLGAHIPGRPNVIVENMLGAGSLRAAFEASVTDEGLRKEAATLGLRPAPQSAAATAASVRALADTPQKIRDRIVAILGWRN